MNILITGGDVPAVVTDATTPTPQGSYGIQKLIGELLVQDDTRKGFINGRSVHIPTVVVRPGRHGSIHRVPARWVLRLIPTLHQSSGPISRTTPARWRECRASAAATRGYTSPRSGSDDRRGVHMPGRKVRTPAGRVLANGQAQQAHLQGCAQGDGQWHRKQTAQAAAQSADGKGEKVG